MHIVVAVCGYFYLHHTHQHVLKSVRRRRPQQSLRLTARALYVNILSDHECRHIPKCGSAFITVMVQTHCLRTTLLKPKIDAHTSKECGAKFLRLANGHEGLTIDKNTRNGHAPAAVNAERLANMVTMLRHPLARLVSGFFHGFHDCVDSKPSGDTRKDMLQLLMRRINTNHSLWHDAVANVTVVRAYYECVRGLSTKMYNGMHSTKTPFFTPTAKDVETAVQKINGAAFVGITELFNASVCL